MSRYLAILILSVTFLIDVSLASATDQRLVELGQAMIGPLHKGLKQLFVVPDFEMSVAECGEKNAFSDGDGNITLCAELISAIMAAPGFDQETKVAALAFILLHETGHSLLNLWGLPLWDNEDAADEFAAVFFLFGGQDEVLRKAASYWATQNSVIEALSKVWINDRHALWGQRARNLRSWVGRRDELLQRWQRIIIPHLQTTMLTRAKEDSWVDTTMVNEELARRLGGGKSGRPRHHPTSGLADSA